MLKIYNPITEKKEIFIFPKKDNIINIYVCGITPYNYSHIGHARTFIIFDIIIKYFIYLGYKINYIRNITDIDDKIINKSKKENIKINCLTNYYITEYRKSFDKLNIIKPNSEPKVTNYINNIINTINILIKKDNAYIYNKNVFFKIDSYKKYGLLSKRKKNFNIFSDFILWKNSLNKNKPYWKSPWGIGRPGWHIECTTLSNIFLKNRIDIHGGGMDLIFPHHENELAQSICAYNDFEIKNWIHIGTVNITSKKISKSCDNKYYLKNIINKFNIESIRYFLTKKHYRKPIELNINDLKKDNIFINKLNNIINSFNIKKIKTNIKTEFTKEFIKCINNDFNIPKSYSIIFEMIKEANKIKFKKYNIALNIIQEAIKLGSITGILKKYNCFNTNINFINKLIYKRNIARKYKKWKIADNIRNILLSKNIILEDDNEKTFWKYLIK